MPSNKALKYGPLNTPTNHTEDENTGISTEKIHPLKNQVLKLSPFNSLPPLFPEVLLLLLGEQVLGALVGRALRAAAVQHRRHRQRQQARGRRGGRLQREGGIGQHKWIALVVVDAICMF